MLAGSGGCRTTCWWRSVRRCRFQRTRSPPRRLPSPSPSCWRMWRGRRGWRGWRCRRSPSRSWSPSWSRSPRPRPSRSRSRSPRPASPRTSARARPSHSPRRRSTPTTVSWRRPPMTTTPCWRRCADRSPQRSAARAMRRAQRRQRPSSSGGSTAWRSFRRWPGGRRRGSWSARARSFVPPSSSPRSTGGWLGATRPGRSGGRRRPPCSRLRCWVQSLASVSSTCAPALAARAASWPIVSGRGACSSPTTTI